jgi:quinol-cytochrome oxidoreductase complex cytochrome b subunit
MVLSISNLSTKIDSLKRITLALSMANSSCYPLPELRITRLREKATVVGIPNPILGIGIGIGIGIGVGVGIVILSVAQLLLLPEINQHQQRSCQSNNKETLEHTLVDIEIQVIIVAILVAFRFQATILIIVSPLLIVKVFVIAFLVVLDECFDPLAESATGPRF